MLLIVIKVNKQSELPLFSLGVYGDAPQAQEAKKIGAKDEKIGKKFEDEIEYPKKPEIIEDAKEIPKETPPVDDNDSGEDKFAHLFRKKADDDKVNEILARIERQTKGTNDDENKGKTKDFHIFE
jgi:hypothetical protein